MAGSRAAVQCAWAPRTLNEPTRRRSGSAFTRQRRADGVGRHQILAATNVRDGPSCACLPSPAPSKFPIADICAHVYCTHSASPSPALFHPSQIDV
uniref:Uncharacterized protein n=1 Tax=Plectus sambesii TaxID=2011161 RepID=A0A914WY09_9BILA